MHCVVVQAEPAGFEHCRGTPVGMNFAVGRQKCFALIVVGQQLSGFEFVDPAVDRQVPCVEF